MVDFSKIKFAVVEPQSGEIFGIGETEKEAIESAREWGFSGQITDDDIFYCSPDLYDMVSETNARPYRNVDGVLYPK